MIALKEYVDQQGKSSFGSWFFGLDAPAAARISAALVRLELGNFSNVKGVGEGVFEYRINFGPGYRIYFGKDGEQFVILLAGDTKKRQQEDIDDSKSYWNDYKRRKKTEL